MLSLHARRSHIQIFSIFNLLYMVCMEYALLQRIVTHDYIEKCLCGGNASWADKTSDLSVTTSPGSILYCDVLKKIYTSNVYFILQSAVGGMGGWGGESLQSRCQEPQKHFARCGRLHAVSGSWCAHTGTLA